jgi:hypothetical protein
VRSALFSRLPRMRNAPSPTCMTCSRRPQTLGRRHDKRTACRFPPALADPYVSGDQRRDPGTLSAARGQRPVFLAPVIGTRNLALLALLRGKMAFFARQVIALPVKSRSRPAVSLLRAR